MSAWRDPALRHRICSLGLRHGSRRWLVDCTPDVREQLMLLGAPPLDGILLTHAHMGHYTGLLHLGPEAWAPRGIKVLAMPGMQAFLKEHAPWLTLVEQGHIEFVDLAHREPLALTDQLTVTPWLVPHRGPWTETVGFEFSGPHKSVFFVPDIDRWEDWDEDLASVLSRVDVAYVDGSFFDAGELPHRDPAKILHPLVRHTMDRMQTLPGHLRERLRFLHLNHTNPLLRPNSEAWQEVQARGFRVASELERISL